LAKPRWLETGCGLLFALPFCAGGLIAAGVAIRDLFGPPVELEQRILLPVFALVFGGVGFGLVAAVFKGRKSARVKAERMAAHPGAPWLWRDEWRDGRVRCSSRAGALALSAFAALWMLISAPVAFVALREELPAGNKAAWVALVFPAVGLMLMSWAALALVRWRKYGSSVFEMATLPGVIGGPLEGIVQVAADIAAQDGIRVRLSNVERTTRGSGDNRSTQESVLWQDECPVPVQSIARSRAATAVPVAFRIPFDARPSEEVSPSRSVLWRLELSAETPGADYESSFEVPVFRTSDSSPDDPDAPCPRIDLPAAPRDPRIRVSRTVAGRLELGFPAFRHPGLSLGFGAFTALWWGVVAALGVSDAPLLFPVVFGGFGLLIGSVWAGLTFGASRAIADPDRLSVRHSWFGLPGRTRSVAASQVQRFRLKIGLQAGGARKTAYHDLIAELAGGGKLTIARALRSRREGEWLIARLEEALRERDTGP
jgi:hypothetical protein